MLRISLILGAIAALADVAGGFVLVRAKGVERFLRYFVALGAGFLMATAVLEMMPESLKQSQSLAPVLIMSGYCVVHLLEHTINAHFHYGEETHISEFVSHRTGYSVRASLRLALFLGLLVVPAIAMFHWMTIVLNAGNSYERARALDIFNPSSLGIIGWIFLFLAFLNRPKKGKELFLAFLNRPKKGEEIQTSEFVSHRTGYSVLVGLSVHALFDGVAIGSGFVISNWLGWLIFLAIFLHKAPEGFTMASVMLASGRSRAAAFYSAVVLAAATLAGVLVIGVSPSLVLYGLPLSAGVALYVAATDLVPEVNREPGIRMALVFFAGVGGFLLLRLLLPAL